MPTSQPARMLACVSTTAFCCNTFLYVTAHLLLACTLSSGCRCAKDITSYIKNEGLSEQVQFSQFPDGGFTLFEEEAQRVRELADLSQQADAGARACVGERLSTKDLSDRLGCPAPAAPWRDGSSSDPPAALPFTGGMLQPRVSRVTAALFVQASALAPPLRGRSLPPLNVPRPPCPAGSAATGLGHRAAGIA
jgi:hypothetical protein